MDISDYVRLGYLALQHRGEIETLIEKAGPYWPMVKPIIAKAQHDWPEIAPLVKSLSAAFMPDTEALVAPAYDVQWLQESLKKVGIPVVVDNVMSEVTRAAVREYQKKRGLTVDGWAGALTCATLDHEVRGSA